MQFRKTRNPKERCLNPALKVKDKSDKKAKIFIVDDHPIIRQGLAQLINYAEDMIFVGEAGNAKEAIQGIEKTKPDLVIADISLEGTSGIELTKALLAKQPNMLVLIVSMYDESVYLERSLRAGAKGYLTKQEASDYIILAIRKVLAGEIYVNEKWSNKLMHRFAEQGTVANASHIVNLSDRELEVLQLIGQGYTTQQIADTLHVSVKTVESHYANIKSKVALKNSHELIQYAVKWCLSEK